MSDILLAQVSLPGCIYPMQAVQLPDGSRGATVRSICLALSLDYPGQYQRIRRTPSLMEALHTITLDTTGGPQEADVLPGWCITIWLAGIQLKRLPASKRALIRFVQQKVVLLIENAFTSRKAAPSAPASEPPPGVVNQIREGFSLLTESFIRLATEHQDLEERVTTLEGGPARHAMIAFSPQRLAHLYLLARQLRASQGLPIGETLAGLADHFEVEDISDLPDSAWPAVLTWFDSLR